MSFIATHQMPAQQKQSPFLTQHLLANNRAGVIIIDYEPSNNRGERVFKHCLACRSMQGAIGVLKLTDMKGLNQYHPVQFFRLALATYNLRRSLDYE
jgi:hypothetical protein